MPFARVGKRIARGMPNIVTMSLNQNKANKTLVVHIGEEVAEDCGFKLGERAEVLWGDGDDLGIVMLVIPEEKDIGVMWKDNMPRMSHSTTRMPEWALPFTNVEVEILSREKGELVMKLPKEDEVMKRAPLASSDIKRPDPKITVKAPAKPAEDDQPAHPEPTADNTFKRETKSPRRPDRYRAGARQRT